MSDRVIDRNRVLVGWQYEILVLLADGPLTGGEVAVSYPLNRFNWLPRVAGNKLAWIERRTGFVEKVDGIWQLTDRGCDWLEACR